MTVNIGTLFGILALFGIIALCIWLTRNPNP